MTSQKTRVLRWAGLVLALAAFVVYRIEDPGAAKPPPVPKPPTEQQRGATRLAVLADGGADVAVQRAELRQYLADSGVSSESIDTVFRHTRDGIALRPGRDGARTRLGGPALLPAGEKWPTAATGDRLSFIAALDFAELPRTKELPEDGLLALYWDRDWRKRKGKRDFVAATRTFFIAPGEPSREPKAPKSTLPIGYKPLRGAAMPIAGDPKLMAGELRGRADAAQVRKALGELELQGVYPHHVLGSPIEDDGAVLQGMSGYFNPTLGYLTEASRERFTPAERTSGKWTLLAQFEEQEGFDLARGSKLYFVILERDLELGRFDRVIGIEDSD